MRIAAIIILAQSHLGNAADLSIPAEWTFDALAAPASGHSNASASALALTERGSKCPYRSPLVCMKWPDRCVAQNHVCCDVTEGATSCPKGHFCFLRGGESRCCLEGENCEEEGIATGNDAPGWPTPTSSLTTTLSVALVGTDPAAIPTTTATHPSTSQPPQVPFTNSAGRRGVEVGMFVAGLVIAVL